MEIKPEDRWLLSVLHNLSHAGSIGDSERRMWSDPKYREACLALWKDSPKWFKDAARPYLGKNYQPKTKPKSQWSGQIMDAIESFSKGDAQ